MYGVVRRPRAKGSYRKGMKDFYGTKGYRHSYGKYVGTLAIMMDYLKFQDITAYNKYNKMIIARKTNKFTHDELKKIKYEVLSYLSDDTRRKFLINGEVTH